MCGKPCSSWIEVISVDIIVEALFVMIRPRMYREDIGMHVLWYQSLLPVNLRSD